MPSTAQAAVGALEARREVRAGRPDSPASLRPARSAWLSGVPGVLRVQLPLLGRGAHALHLLLVLVALRLQLLDVRLRLRSR